VSVDADEVPQEVTFPEERFVAVEDEVEQNFDTVTW